VLDIVRRFWSWYEANIALATSVAAVLFGLQLAHLYWLTADVVLFRLTGVSYFDPSPIVRWVILVVDYLEIQAIVSVSLVYFNDFRRGERARALLFLALVNSQWLHLFWITDEFVLAQFGVGGLGLPGVLAWLAIGIDYLELPVIVDTLRRLPRLLRARPPTERLRGSSPSVGCPTHDGPGRAG
jgi:hypothetical protein